MICSNSKIFGIEGHSSLIDIVRYYVLKVLICIYLHHCKRLYFLHCNNLTKVYLHLQLYKRWRALLLSKRKKSRMQSV